MWYGPQFVARPRNVDMLMLTNEVEFEDSGLYYEKQILIEALEFWLPSLEALCEDQSIPSMSTEQRIRLLNNPGISKRV